MAPTLQLDVRPIPAAQKNAEIFRTFDELAPGQSFSLVNDHDPKSLLLQFQADRPNAFDWMPLEAGPKQWRIEIRRRTENGPRRLSDYHGRDHARLDQILGDVKDRAEAGQFDEAAPMFAEFRCGLERHLFEEEQVLFPEVVKLADDLAGPVGELGAEHEKIRALLQEVQHALVSEDTGTFLTSGGDLEQLLRDHDGREGRILYPTTEKILDARAADEIVRKMQAAR